MLLRRRRTGVCSAVDGSGRSSGGSGAGVWVPALPVASAPVPSAGNGGRLATTCRRRPPKRACGASAATAAAAVSFPLLRRGFGFAVCYACEPKNRWTLQQA